MARWRDAAAADGPADVALGFSGAGVTLPAVALAVGAHRVVWVDALVPARSGATEADDGIRALVAERVRDGRIPDWTTWWGSDAMAELLPDERLRAAVRADGHELPGDFYDGAAAEARDRGWPVVGDGAGNHLDVATSPGEVAALLG